MVEVPNELPPMTWNERQATLSGAVCKADVTK
jgi:dihydropyrimidine dehydrogenase (NAD+) subunit PreA